jgi:Uma2 family endonuclease
MSSAPNSADRLLTLDEYARLPNLGRPNELILGKVVEMNVPAGSHGKYLLNIGRALGRYLDQHDVGHLTGEVGVITRREPDSLRAPDVAFYSYARLPAGEVPEGYWQVSPELAFEVRSRYDRWVEIVAKVGEFLSAGVLVVAVLDPPERKLHVYSADRPTLILAENELFQVGDFLPDILPECTLAVRDFLK